MPKLVTMIAFNTALWILREIVLWGSISSVSVSLEILVVSWDLITIVTTDTLSCTIRAKGNWMRHHLLLLWLLIRFICSNSLCCIYRFFFDRIVYFFGDWAEICLAFNKTSSLECLKILNSGCQCVRETVEILL